MSSLIPNSEKAESVKETIVSKVEEEVATFFDSKMVEDDLAIPLATQGAVDLENLDKIPFSLGNTE
jgi:hypothetical protein